MNYHSRPCRPCQRDAMRRAGLVVLSLAELAELLGGMIEMQAAASRQSAWMQYAAMHEAMAGYVVAGGDVAASVRVAIRHAARLCNHTMHEESSHEEESRPLSD